MGITADPTPWALRWYKASAACLGVGVIISALFLVRQRRRPQTTPGDSHEPVTELAPA